jgi:hypothetical protein
MLARLTHRPGRNGVRIDRATFIYPGFSRVRWAAHKFPCYATCNSLLNQRNSLFRFLGNSEGTL